MPVALRPPRIDFPGAEIVAADLLCATALGIDRNDDALVSEFVGGFSHEIRIVDRRRIDRNLVGAAEQQLADIGDGPHTAADGERHETLLGGACDDIEDRLAVIRGCGNVEEAELVGTGRIIGLGRFDGIAGIDQIEEIDALDDTAVLDVEAGDHAGFQGHYAVSFARAAFMRSSASLGSIRPS
jgi:hypothetical protein